ncbi:DUF6701 domain-containing protein [Photobacterium leiognathi]|uniref:MSHA biogenesis protein MshQ n=1 Tax=Photobacterium leiognathi subsp. mandapamensis TaxID=48408 RepID=A0A2T3KX32_PHOLD|nr:DUF6701 domain-containing protein [Photobacterium leiognathi]PSV12016.1 MSHA biogenesis protein MshQ [Photobacterium leiognathi subsp. mandapamensis]
MKACFQTVLLFLFSTLISFQVNAGEYEFGHYEYSATDKCHLSNSVNGCTIQFKKQYSQTPLVFLMPTIPANNPDADRPQTVSLLNVTKDSFTIKQFSAPLDDDIKLNKELMMSISYFVMEPGELILDDGHKIYAGFINTGRYAGDGEGSKPAYKNVNISDFSFSESPIVLSEVQTRNNNRWFTSAVHNITATQLKLGLEITRVERDDVPDDDKPFPKTEKIAYLISEPVSGLSGGYQYEFTKGIVLQAKGDKPLKMACDGSNDFQQGYDYLPFVIGGKLERNGGQGGWLRRCALTDKDVSFVIDEDIPESTNISSRRHTNEKVGFLAFAKKPSLPPLTDDYCEYFPSVAQSYNKIKSMFVRMGSEFPPFFKINTNARYQLGFTQKLDQGGDKDKSCQNTNQKWNCDINGEYSKLYEMPEMPPYTNIPSGQFRCDSVPEQYKDQCIELKEIDGIDPFKLEPNKNYLKVELQENTRTLLRGGIYKIHYLYAHQRSNIEVAEGETAIIYVEKAEIGGVINKSGKPENLYIFGTSDDGDVTEYQFKSSITAYSSTEITAYIYSKGNVILSANYDDKYNGNYESRLTTLRGAITARNLRIDSETKIIGDGICLNPPPSEDLILEIIPNEHYSLTCDDLLVTFNVKNEDGELANNFNGIVSVSTDISSEGLAHWSLPSDDSVSFDAYMPIDVTIKNGQGRLRLHSPNYIGNIKVTGKAEDPSITNDVEGNYTFVPFKFGFTPSPVKTIAGKPISVTISALACNDGTSSVATGYSGNKELTIGTTFIAPREIGNGNIEIRKSNGHSWKTKYETLDFSAGVAEFDLRYPDAGKVSLSVSDPKCSLETGCDSELTSGTDDEYDGWELLQGSVEVHARPWTFAVCPKNKDGEYVKADGTSSSGEGFVATGDKFDVDVKPIVWRSAGSETADINSLYSNSIDLCESVITPNFFKAGAPAARVELSIPSDHSITPVNGKPGELQGITVKEHTETLTYADLSWSEVGSVRLQADAKAPYLAMTINQGYRHLGRFYPKYLEIQPNSFVYTDGHGAGGNNFAYLSQPFNANVQIKAKNALGDQVENYNVFVSDFQAEVSLMAYEYPSLNSLNDRFSYHHITRSTDQSFKGRWNSDIEQVWLLERKSVTKTPLTTVEDGPWNDSNSRWGGYISSYHDPIFIRNTATGVTDDVDSKQVALFETTPNLHYGRMVLSDAISMFDKPVTIPLKIEHWNGTEFVTHGDDSGSKYNSNYFCKVALHPTGAENESILTANKIDNVTFGKSDKIEAHPNLSKPDDYKKQQTRFWLRIANDAPVDIGCSQDNKEYQPWLTYNWRELGDEDPSAVVTFGVYRGNDRIVYRGEKGLN